MDSLFNRLLSRSSALLLPGLLLALSYWGLTYLHILTEQWQMLIMQAAPVICLLVAVGLSVQFNRTGFVFALLLVLAGGAASKAGLEILTPYQPYIFSVLFIDLLIFSVLKDRGLFSIHGIARVAFLGLQAGVGYYIATQSLEFIQPVLAFEIPFEFSVLVGPEIAALPWPIWVGAIACSIQLMMTLLSDKANYPVFLGAQVVLLLMISDIQTQVWVPLLLIAFSMIVCFNVLRQSYDMAYRDELTALPSRRALNQLILSLGRRYTIAMMDIDHFKKFNDTHGHDIGDEVLRMVASKIARVGGGGKPHRYGGEEFTVVFPGKTPEQAEPYLEKLRETIADYQMVVRAKRPKKIDKKTAENAKSKRSKDKDLGKYKTLSVTISIGIAERTNTQKTPMQVIKAADEALYRAKKAGRNCVQH